MPNDLKAAWEVNDGPIPGENFTSNTKNYPWHRPPEIKDIDEGIDFFIKRVVSDKKKSAGLMTLIEMGFPITTATDIIVTQGIANGKWTPDFAILLAGPVARIIEMMAKGAGIKDYVKGWEEDTDVPTSAFFELQTKGDVSDKELYSAKKQAIQTANEVKGTTAPTGGGGLGMPPTKPPEPEMEEIPMGAEQPISPEEMLQ